MHTDPPEPIHGVIGVDRAHGLRVTVKELPLMSCWEATASHNRNTKGGYGNVFISAFHNAEKEAQKSATWMKANAFKCQMDGIKV